jgi:hypothetical protein
VIVSLFGNRALGISEAQAAKIDAIITRERPPKFIKINDQTVLVADITGLYAEDVWDTMQREAEGQTQCRFGEWHKKGENCGHRDKAVAPVSFDEFRKEPSAEALTTKEAFTRMIQINAKWMKQHGVFGTLRDLDDLEAFDKTGKMPEVAKELNKQTPVFPVGS